MAAEEQSELRTFFDEESKLSDAKLDACDERWAESGALDVIRDEPWGAEDVDPVDVYGTTWGHVLDGVVPQVLLVRGTPTITIPEGIPSVE